jgi:hypothetical protein
VKDTKELLHTFSKLYLAQEADFVKHLEHLGFQFGVHQSWLAELDLRVGSFAVDLRDGVRVGKLLDMVADGRLALEKVRHSPTEEYCAEYSCLQHLRAPPVSRLHKIHNVDIVIDGLKRLGVSIEGLDSRAVVDGNRHKTLALVWQIMSLLPGNVEDLQELPPLEKLSREGPVRLLLIILYPCMLTALCRRIAATQSSSASSPPGTPSARRKSGASTAPLAPCRPLGAATGRA